MLPKKDLFETFLQSQLGTKTLIMEANLETKLHYSSFFSLEYTDKDINLKKNLGHPEVKKSNIIFTL